MDKKIDNRSIEEKYQELIMAVENKFLDETRHETALRHIQYPLEPSDPRIDNPSKWTT